MPTKRSKNTPGKASVNRASVRKNGFSGKHSARGFSTSAPGTQQFRPSVKQKAGFSNSQLVNSQFSQVASGGSADSLQQNALITRRKLFIGAAAIGGVALVGGGASAALGQLGEDDNATVDCISVGEGDVEALGDYTQTENYTDCVKLSGSFKLTYGTLVWADNDTVAACLCPTDSASPLATVSLLYLSSGNTATVLKAAQGADDGFEIIDVRCSENGLIWTESNAYDSTWRVYTARIGNGSAEGIVQVDEGDANWSIPSLAAVNNSAFWQITPSTSGEAASEDSVLKAATFGSGNAQVVYTSRKPFATRVGASTDGVVITPRVESTSTYYRLAKITASNYQTSDEMVLPSTMTPDVVGHGSTGFAFGFTSIYNYGGGIANLGTYTPRTDPHGNYNGQQWFRFSRSPITAPCWCGKYFVVKSTTALCGVDLENKSYFAIDTVSGSDDYGEHLVSSGECERIVGLSQITDDSNAENNHALVRVFTPVSASSTSDEE